MTSQNSDDDVEYEYDPEADHNFPDSTLNEVITYITADEEIQALLPAQNVNAVDRMRFNDHGKKHVSIVTNHALRLYELLKDADIPFNGASQQGLQEADESVIIYLAAVLHDVGHIVHRDQHVYYSIPIASNILDRILPEFYGPADAIRMKGEILHAILCHHTEEVPLTTEAGIIRVADALDMERGRSRIPYEKGGRGINTISSQAIKQVSLHTGNDRPVLVEIAMTNAAGVFQVDNLLKAKLVGSGLEDYIRIVAINSAETTEQLVERIEL